ncbi:polysaccharide deacetylase [Accumulibacter sp.]|uniref:polysaccharide deacetylase family protein n=1 Tax=Accumulibacter sp. TaxID=2053492 RepID=UPI0025CFD261|nr:polysaccharide deacetylase [Accumulibacter sp.]MCM8595186.1 polysaccharide deacetylase [Accumulibacter sp.]MCM8625200.1 polysaccharide deacetylase [Accumulibacter sp.]MDS4049332.1 polysaccharide deacetylase [Accumulibacter sp.]
MLNVFFTVDVEIWCDGWEDIDRKFPEAFRRYIHGPTPRGGFGLPYQLDVLRDQGIGATFFVEPLFSTRFGPHPLEEIVHLVREGGQEVQLHLHTEWVDESREPLLEDCRRKRQHLFMFSRDEQRRLITIGLGLLRAAGADAINAFRAGSFGFNVDTLRALSASGIDFDSSYNATLFGPGSGVLSGRVVVEPVACEGVIEYPMAVFDDGTGLRHVQLAACSSAELESLLWQALERQRKAFVILSHSFELLNQAKNRPDDIVVRRFRRLCAFLDRNRDSFRSCRFSGLTPDLPAEQPAPLTSGLWATGRRIIEQAYRRRYR